MTVKVRAPDGTPKVFDLVSSSSARFQWFDWLRAERLILAMVASECLLDGNLEAAVRFAQRSELFAEWSRLLTVPGPRPRDCIRAPRAA